MQHVEVPAQVVVQDGAGAVVLGAEIAILAHRRPDHEPVLFEYAEIRGITDLAVPVRVVRPHRPGFQHRHGEVEHVAAGLEDRPLAPVQSGNGLRPRSHVSHLLLDPYPGTGRA